MTKTRGRTFTLIKVLLIKHFMNRHLGQTNVFFLPKYPSTIQNKIMEIIWYYRKMVIVSFAQFFVVPTYKIFVHVFNILVTFYRDKNLRKRVKSMTASHFIHLRSYTLANNIGHECSHLSGEALPTRLKWTAFSLSLSLSTCRSATFGDVVIAAHARRNRS